MSYDERTSYGESTQRRRNAREMRRQARDCDHMGEKKVDGNKIICGKCGRLAGFLRDPRKVIA